MADVTTAGEPALTFFKIAAGLKQRALQHAQRHSFDTVSLRQGFGVLPKPEC